MFLYSDDQYFVESIKKYGCDSKNLSRNVAQEIVAMFSGDAVRMILTKTLQYFEGRRTALSIFVLLDKMYYIKMWPDTYFCPSKLK